jgi:hypothetical protein
MECLKCIYETQSVQSIRRVLYVDKAIVLNATKCQVICIMMAAEVEDGRRNCYGPPCEYSANFVCCLYQIKFFHLNFQLRIQDGGLKFEFWRQCAYFMFFLNLI